MRAERESHVADVHLLSYPTFQDDRYERDRKRSKNEPD
jgi:hypothetical protein